MINEDFKEQQQSYFLKHKAKHTNNKNNKKQAKIFNNSKLVYAFHKKSKPHHHTQPSKIKNTEAQHIDKGTTLGNNFNLSYQMFNVVPNTDPDKKAQLLKKKSLSILKSPERIKQYKSLTLIKKGQEIDPQIKLSRTQILKSILIQYDRNVQNKIYLKKQVSQSQRDQPSFFTQLGNSTDRARINTTSKSVQSSRYRKSLSKGKQNTNEQKYKISLTQDQIEVIVRKSLKEIDQGRYKQKKQVSKSLISFTKKAIYLKKMKKVQTSLDNF